MRTNVTPPQPAAGRTGVPQLIVTDLDGTFLSPDGTVSEQNRAAVLAAQDVGIPVLFATGRPVPSATFALESATRFAPEPASRTWRADPGGDPAVFTGPAEEIARREDF